MLNFISEIKKGLLGTLFATLIFVISFYPILDLNIGFHFLKYVDPIFFLPFLFTPYLNKISVIVGSFVGSFVFAIVTHLNIAFAIVFSIIISASFLIYSLFFRAEPDRILYYVTNSILLIITILEVGWLASFIKALFAMQDFFTALSAYSFFGGIITFVVVSYLTIFYGVKLNSAFYVLRK